MKEIANFIRYITPSWSDKDRYKWLSTIHAWLIPTCLILFIFISNPIVRFFVLFMQVIAIITEFFFKDCLITMVEKEFSEETWDDIASRIFKVNGWELTRPEKMSFNIGLNVGILIMFVITLLRESMLWMVGLAGVSIGTIAVMPFVEK
jgi:hypothetical protein